VPGVGNADNGDNIEINRVGVHVFVPLSHLMYLLYHIIFGLSSGFGKIILFFYFQKTT
jgi:hypothetical protein